MQNKDGIVPKRPRKKKNKQFWINPGQKQFNPNQYKPQQPQPPFTQQPLEGEPIELSDDNAPKNPMAHTHQNKMGQNPQNQPKLNLAGSNQTEANKTNKPEPILPEVSSSVPFQSGPRLPGPRPPGPKPPGPKKNKNKPHFMQYRLQSKWQAFQSSLQNMNNFKKASSSSSLNLTAKQRVIEQMKKKGLISENEAAEISTQQTSNESNQKFKEQSENKDDKLEDVAESKSEPEPVQPSENQAGAVQNYPVSQPVTQASNEEEISTVKGSAAPQLVSWVQSKNKPQIYRAVYNNATPNINAKTLKPQNVKPIPTHMPNSQKKTPLILAYSYPKGIPKSFLASQINVEAQNVLNSNVLPQTPTSWPNMQMQNQFYQQHTMVHTPTVVQASVPLMAQSNMPMVQHTNMPMVQPNNMLIDQATNLPMVQPTNMLMMDQTNMLMMAQTSNMSMMAQTSNLPMMAQTSNMPMMAQTNMPMVQPTNMPMMAQSNMAMAQSTNMPMMAQTNMPTMAQANITMMQANNMPMTSPTNVLMYGGQPGCENQHPVDQTPMEIQQAYSPTEMFNETSVNENEEVREGTESPDLCQGGQKRLSAFKRLGPLAEPKKPKLTINILFNKEQAVREVVDQTDAKVNIPVHLRQDVKSSKDPIVKEYLPYWPWKRNVPMMKSVTVRNSKSVMILEREQMQDEVYDKNHMFAQVMIKDYPPTWTKERVLDLILESVRGKTFIPCFIEFNQSQCKFLIIRSRAALLTIHKYGFILRAEGAEMTLTISQVDLAADDVGLVPWTALRKKLNAAYDGERKLNLSAFTLGSDISHFVYFPLHRVTNQVELVQFQSDVVWDYVTDLDLSHNRITTIQGFDFPTNMPRLKHLNLSHNHIEKVSVLLKCREILLRSIWLEGNPLCHDYIDPAEYIKVVRMIFPTVTEIDGEKVQRKGEFPCSIRNYCPEEAVCVVEKFLEVFFPLLEAGCDQRPLIQDLYDSDAVMTITYRYKLRINPMFRYYNTLFLKSRVLEEGLMEVVEGSCAISKLISKWPNFTHDPFTFTVDVMHHDETSTILRIGGIMKLTSETLAEDEHLIAFSRTIVLRTNDGAQYKIKNEMVFWDEPTKETAKTAFQVTAIKTKPLSLNLETVPDDDLKDKFIDIIMKLTEMKRKPSEKLLQIKEWNLKNALEYFSRLLKLDSLDSLQCDE